MLSRLAILPTGPMLIAQARRLRRDTPRLPDAAPPWQGTLPGPEPLQLLVLGDSTAAGVGADTQENALPGALARELAARLGRGVHWRAVGRNGATARDLIEDYLGQATSTPADLVFLSVGANDALGIRSRAAFARDIRSIVSRLRRSNPDATIIMSSLPAFHRFELLPNPLRWNLALHSRSLEDAARAIMTATPNATMSPKPPPYTAGFFASDLFHPSAQGYRDWARFAIEDAALSGSLPPAAT